MKQTISEDKLSNFRHLIKRKHQSIKIDFKFSKDKTEFLHNLVNKDKNNRLQKTLFKKPTDCKNYQYAKSAHPYLLKINNTFSHVLKIKNIYETFEEYRKHTTDLSKLYKRLQKT